jgi:O-antigen/teichoic acid export membrane protein
MTNSPGCPKFIKNNPPLLLVFLILALIAIAAPLTVSRASSPARPAAQTIPSQNLQIFYAGPEDSIYSALSIAPNFTLVDDPLSANAIVLNGIAPELPAIQQALDHGAGLVLFLGENSYQAQLQALTSSPLSLAVADTPLSLVAASQQNNPLAQEIAWNSAPQVRERVALPPGEYAPLVLGYEDQSLILVEIAGEAPSYIFAPFLGDKNTQFQEWANFNYLIYNLTSRAAGSEPASFGSYSGSPVPHAAERNVLFLILLGLLAISFLAFYFVRRYSLAHPEILDNLVSNRQEYQDRQAVTDWDEIGFHRPLGGFMLAFMLGLVLFVPIIIYQNLILPVYILPSAQALGIWGRVVQFFNFLWLFLDMGTSAAFIKFFAEYRVHEPRKAIQYGQIFVWWQALSGAIQVAVMVALASIALPHTTYAIYAWSIIIHTLIQLPGFFQVFRHALMAWQRLDYAQIVELAWALVFPIFTQPVLAGLMVAWGRTHPVFGPSMGGLLGLGFAAYATEALTFLLGYWLYHRLGYNARLLFLAHFDWSTIKNSFRYGIFEMLGSVAWAAGQAVEIVITQTRLVNYTEVWGNWVLAQNFVYAFNVLQSLNNGLVPAISEAISNGRKALSQYYSAMAYKWGGLISAFIAAVLLAVADRFILGASGPEFARAAAYAVPLILWGAIQYPSWVGDTVQLGSNRPYLKACMVAGEQALRIILIYVFLERFQINALIIAYFIGLLTKDILGYFINHRVCYPQRFFFWQSLGAPILAGAVHFLLLRWITGIIWQGDQITSVVIFLIGILISFPVYAFLYGLFGGWDQAILAELHHSARLSNFMRPLSIVFWASTAAGARLSPLNNRFPIDIREDALREAQSLTNERVQL